jgi:DNA-directed RNA polymerase specialized sigma24 family protein
MLLRAHAGRVRKVLARRYAYVLDDDHLDAAVADAAQKALARHKSERGSLGGWFLFLADRQAVNILRGEEPHRSNTVPLGEAEYIDRRSEAPSDLAAAAELAAAVQEAIATQLSDLERAVIQADLDAAGAASVELLAKSLGTTNWSIYAARARGRAKLEAALTPRFLAPRNLELEP